MRELRKFEAYPGCTLAIEAGPMPDAGWIVHEIHGTAAEALCGRPIATLAWPERTLEAHRACPVCRAIGEGCL